MDGELHLTEVANLSGWHLQDRYLLFASFSTFTKFSFDNQSLKLLFYPKLTSYRGLKELFVL